MSKKKKNRTKGQANHTFSQDWWRSPELAERSRAVRNELHAYAQGQGLTLICDGTTPDGNYWSYRIKEAPTYNAKVRIYYD